MVTDGRLEALAQSVLPDVYGEPYRELRFLLANGIRTAYGVNDAAKALVWAYDLLRVGLQNIEAVPATPAPVNAPTDEE